MFILSYRVSYTPSHVSDHQYASHREDRGCHSRARPPEAKQDKFSFNTCHQRFKREKANDFHELCKAAKNNIPARTDKWTKAKKLTLAMAAEVRWRYVRISIKAADMIPTYRAALKKPNTNGTYNVNARHQKANLKPIKSAFSPNAQLKMKRVFAMPIIDQRQTNAPTIFKGHTPCNSPTSRCPLLVPIMT